MGLSVGSTLANNNYQFSLWSVVCGESCICVYCFGGGGGGYEEGR